MLIIADKKIPEDAKNNLRKYGELVFIETKGITEESISGHPDIFFCKTNDVLFVAPNLPDFYKDLLIKNKVSFIKGNTSVGMDYPAAASYNAVLNERFYIHRCDISDSKLLENCNHLQRVNVRQGFTRCSLLLLKENHYITSDEGIHKALRLLSFSGILVNAKDIVLSGQIHGFFGGTCGVYESAVFFTGSLSHYSDGEKVKLFLKHLGYKIIELSDSPLFDGGSILIV